MTSKIREHLLAFLLVITLLSSCQASPDLLPGQLIELQPGASWRGISAVVSGARETYRYTNNGQILLVWFQRPGWGFTCMNCNAVDPVGLWRWLSGGKALYSNQFATINQVVRNNGWQEVRADQLPQDFRQAVQAGAQAFAAYVSRLAVSWVSIVVLPVGAFPMPARVIDG